jgi:hypothetical protein
LLVALHLMPAVLLVTWPAPMPASATVRVAGNAVKLADTPSAACIVTMQVPVPLHAPPHPAKVEPPAGAAVNITCVPDWKLALQMDPQLIPDGSLVTVLEPVPVDATERLKLGIAVKVAVTLSAALIVTMQELVPLHPAPDQPAKVDPAAAEAVRVTDELKTNGAAHCLAPQLIPAGVLVTTPLPVPFSATVKLSGAKVPIALLPESVNHIEPLGPIVIPCAEGLVPGMGYSVMAPLVVIWPIAVPVVNHKA